MARQGHCVAFSLPGCLAGPAGVPDSASVQEVIFWQGRTIQMMYHIIGQAMQKAGVHDQHPKDYLSFYCLGTAHALHTRCVLHG